MCASIVSIEAPPLIIKIVYYIQNDSLNVERVLLQDILPPVPYLHLGDMSCTLQSVKVIATRARASLTLIGASLNSNIGRPGTRPLGRRSACAKQQLFC